MRKIKFRAWDLDNEKMYFDNISREENDGNSCLHFFWGFQLPRNQFTFNHVIMQFTGFHDKEGKEIYEGDISKINMQEEWYKYGVVKFHEGGFYFFIDDASLPLAQFAPYINIHGNIYENPELIKNERN